MKTLMNGNRTCCLVIITAFFLSIVGIYGCGSGGGGASDGGGGSGGSPEITLSSSDISFSNLVANKQADRSLTVQNTGTAGLVIGQIAQANPLAAPFSIPDDGCSGTTLAPTQSCTVIVRFAPTTQGDFEDVFSIPSNDADEASLVLNVRGKGQGLNVTINNVDSSVAGKIKVLVSVTDSSDAPELGFVKDFFTLLEGGAGKSIDPFSNTVTSPISAVLLLDYSGSFEAFRLQVEAAAKNFLDDLQLTDEAAVIKFAGTVDLAIGFTPVSSGKTDLKNAIDSPYTPIAGTKLYDAVYDAVDRLALRNPAYRRTAIVVSDGVDFKSPTGGQLSTQDLEGVIDNGQQKKIFIYTIGFGPDLPEGNVVMGRMADETGGEFIVSPTAADLNGVYLKISQILSKQYELTFTTSQLAGTGNTLKVLVNNGTLQGDDTVSVTY